METREKRIIERNLPELINTTEVHAQFRAILQSKGILQNADVDRLVPLTGIDKAAAFYRIIVTRVGAYKVTKEALRTTGQSGAFQILESAEEGVQENTLHETRVLLDKPGHQSNEHPTPFYTNINPWKMFTSIGLAVILSLLLWQMLGNWNTRHQTHELRHSTSNGQYIPLYPNMTTVSSTSTELISSPTSEGIFAGRSDGLEVDHLDSPTSTIILQPTLLSTEETEVTATDAAPEITTEETKTLMTSPNSDQVSMQNKAEMATGPSKTRLDDPGWSSGIMNPFLTLETAFTPAQSSPSPVPLNIPIVEKVLEYKVCISSYAEYIHTLRIIPADRYVVLSIILETPAGWPLEKVPLPNSLEITKLSLEGPFLITTLVNILSQMLNLQELHLRNTGNDLCSRNQGQLSLVYSVQEKLHLPSLWKLILKDCTSCPEIYEALALVFEETLALEVLGVHRGVLDDRNHFFIQQLVRKTQGTLRDLEFAETRMTLTTPIFEIGAGVRLRQLKFLRLDSVPSNIIPGLIPIGSKLLKTCPNLRTFLSDHGHVRWMNVSNLLQFRNLTKFQVGIQVPMDHTIFSVAFLRRAFPLLRSANLTIMFQQCTSDLRKQIVGWEDVPETLKEVSVQSNCRIMANLSNTQVEMKAKRDENYSIKGNMYRFNFTLTDSTIKFVN